MDPQAVFCHNLDCPAQSGKGNIGVHSRKDGRYTMSAAGPSRRARARPSFGHERSHLPRAHGGLGTPWAGVGASTGALHQAMGLVGAVYNFCTYHKSLRTPIYLPGNRRRWARRTPAIAAGITDHLWMIEELLCFQVPSPPWRPPKRRGRPSTSTKSLIARWCS